jgi:hypothetical protein
MWVFDIVVIVCIGHLVGCSRIRIRSRGVCRCVVKPRGKSGRESRGEREGPVVGTLYMVGSRFIPVLVHMNPWTSHHNRTWCPARPIPVILPTFSRRPRLYTPSISLSPIRTWRPRMRRNWRRECRNRVIDCRLQGQLGLGRSCAPTRSYRASWAGRGEA